MRGERNPAQLVIIISAVGLLVLLPVVAGIGYFVLGGRSAAPNAGPGGSDPGATRDLTAYTSELMAKVPYTASELKTTSYKADSYVTDPNYPDFFTELVIRVEPVRLEDAITKQAGVYTRVRLTRDRGPEPGVTSVEEAQRRAQAAALGARWLRAEVLP